MPRQPYNRTVHGLALITAAATFPLIFMGGLVTSHQAGMSVPDWPNSWGYNMFTFPPSKWVGGILFEHTHRLAGVAVGLLTIALMIAAWATDRRRWMRWTAVGVFLAVCIQGAIGGLRVVLSLRDLAIVHGCAAQLFFCFIAAFCVMTSRFWAEGRHRPADHLPAVRKVLHLAIGAVAITLIQLVLGAIMRHSDAGLAIPDFPTSFGHLLPPTKIDSAFRQEAIHRYGLSLGLNRVTLFQIWIHFAHRVGAIAVSAAVIAMSAMILRRLRTAGLCQARISGAVAPGNSAYAWNPDGAAAKAGGHRLASRGRGSAAAGDERGHRGAGVRRRQRLGPCRLKSARGGSSLCGGA